MSAYDRVVETLQENGLRWKDIDQIHVRVETYDDLYSRASESMTTSNYETTDAPSIRVTRQKEKIVCVDENGMMQEYEI